MKNKCLLQTDAGNAVHGAMIGTMVGMMRRMASGFTTGDDSRVYPFAKPCVFDAIHPLIVQCSTTGSSPGRVAHGDLYACLG